MNDLLNKYKELISKHKELCFKTHIVNNKFKLFIVSNDGPIYIELDEKYYNDYDIEKDYYFDGYNNKLEATPELLNSNFENVSYFKTEGDSLYKYIGNNESVIIPNDVVYINSEAICNNKFIKYLNGNNVSSMQKNSIYNLPNLERLDFLNARSIFKVNQLPKLREIYISDKFDGIMIDEEFNKDLKINVVSNNKIFEYYYDDKVDDLFFEETEAQRLNNGNLETIRISKTDRKFKTFNDITRFDATNSIASITPAIDNMPDYLKDLLFSNDLIIYLTRGFKEAGGYIPDKNIVIAETSDLIRNFFHEIGHAVDYNMGIVSSNDEFKELFKLERTKLYSTMNPKKKMYVAPDCLINHFNSNEQEFFAECFKRYILKETAFTNECPNTYNYINNLMIELEQKYNQEQESKMRL